MRPSPLCQWISPVMRQSSMATLMVSRWEKTWTQASSAVNSKKICSTKSHCLTKVCQFTKALERSRQCRMMMNSITARERQNRQLDSKMEQQMVRELVWCVAWIRTSETASSRWTIARIVRITSLSQPSLLADYRETRMNNARLFAKRKIWAHISHESLKL